ncbi:hypothetical protein OQA88_900 [Cercophora sp. LCS_1]
MPLYNRKNIYTPITRPNTSSNHLIRLLHLAPATSPSDPLEATLSVAPLSEAPPYEALSYVWGGQSCLLPSSKRLKIGSTSVRIGRNLFLALQQLRYTNVGIERLASERNTETISSRHDGGTIDNGIDGIGGRISQGNSAAEDERAGDRVLWVDALCINQGDVEEKSYQVGLMGRIFSEAATVLIWFGESDRNAEVAFGYVREVHEWLVEWGGEEYKRRYGYLGGGGDGDSEGRTTEEEGEGQPGVAVSEQTEETSEQEQTRGMVLKQTKRVLMADGTKLPDRPALDGYRCYGRAFPTNSRQAFRPCLPTEVRALNQFLGSNQWWSRSWVVQEFCLSRASLAICGGLVVPMDALLIATTELRGGHVDGMPYGITWQLDQVTHSRAASLWTVAKRMRQREMLEPLEVLVLFRWHLSTDPRDKVFSLLGMMRDVGIAHDYTLGVEACHTATARAILESTGTLDLLDFVVSPRPPRRRRFPSWVPDWSEGNWSGGADMGRTHIERVRLDTCTDRNPTFGGPARPRFEGQDILVVEGLEVDDIFALDKPMSPNWVTITDTGPPSWEEPPTVKVPLLGSCLSSLARTVKWLRHGITTIQHYLAMVTTTITDIRYFDQWVRFYQGLCEKDPDQFSRRNYPDFIFQIFLIFGWLYPDLSIQCDRAVRRHSLVWDYITECGWFRFTNNLRFFPTIYGVVLSAWFLAAEDPSHWEDVLDFTDGIRDVGMARGSRLAVTKGKLACLVPARCSAGDKVVLLRGGRHPYVVRRVKKSNCWTLVGPCYVTGPTIHHLREVWENEAAQEMYFK